jgi:hypothetical protein
MVFIGADQALDSIDASRRLRPKTLRRGRLRLRTPEAAHGAPVLVSSGGMAKRRRPVANTSGRARDHPRPSAPERGAMFR